MNSRNAILNKIKSALKNPSRLPDDPDVDRKIIDSLDDITPKSIDGLVEQFQKELEIVSGEFISVASESEAVSAIRKIFDETKHTTFTGTSAALPRRISGQFEKDFTYIGGDAGDRKADMAKAAIGIVDVAYAIADTGTLVVPFKGLDSTFPHFLPDVIVALVYKDQFIANHFELFEKIDTETAQNMVLVTGPSRTADIEKILILGAHGPRRLIVIMMDKR